MRAAAVVLVLTAASGVALAGEEQVQEAQAHFQLKAAELGSRADAATQESLARAIIKMEQIDQPSCTPLIERVTAPKRKGALWGEQWHGSSCLRPFTYDVKLQTTPEQTDLYVQRVGQEEGIRLYVPRILSTNQ